MLKIQHTLRGEGEDARRLEATASETWRRLLIVSRGTRAVLDAHQRMLHEEGDHAPHVFPKRKDRRMRPDDLDRALARFYEKHDLTNISVHGLRHTYAAIRIAAGMSTVELSTLLGHASPAFTLDVYEHLFDKHEMPARPTKTLAEMAGYSGSGCSWLFGPSCPPRPPVGKTKKPRRGRGF